MRRIGRWGSESARFWVDIALGMSDIEQRKKLGKHVHIGKAFGEALPILVELSLLLS